MKTLFPGAVLTLGMILLTLPSSAGTVTYTYTGNPFTNCQVGDCTPLTHVSATLEVAAPLAPLTSYIWGSPGPAGTLLSLLDWSMSNGRDSVAPLIADPGGTNNSAIFLLTDPSGQIASWFVQGADPSYGGPFQPLTIGTGNSISNEDATSLAQGDVGWQYIAFIEQTPGTWQMSESAAPEPGSIGLTVLGGLALLAVRRRRSA